MTSTVTSKFRNSLWISPTLLGILASGLIAVCVSLSADTNNPGNVHEIIVILAILVGLVGYNTYHAVTRFIKVTVNQDMLLARYLLLNNKKAIAYDDIIHVSVVSEKALFRGDGIRTSQTETIKLKIELNTGEKVYLYEEYYENFDELKEAIRRARFNLD